MKSNEKPVIEAEDKTLKVGDKFDPKAGVKAHDAEDGDLTNKIEIVTNNVDTNKSGEYTVVYRVTDADGNKVEKQIKVSVKSNEKPVIEAEDQTLEVGGKFDPKAGVKAHDKEDGDLTNKIEIVTNNVDTNKVGEYTVVYRVTDADGNTVEKQIKVNVTADYNITANTYNIDADSYLTGTVGNGVDAVQIKVNGKVVNNVKVVNGSYKAYIRGYVKSVQDVVTVTSIAKGEAKKTVTVDLVYNDVVLTANDYTIGESSVVGTVDKRATTVFLFDADTNTALRKVELNKDGNYSIAASDLITSTNKNYVVVAKEGSKELKRASLNVKEAPQENYVLTADDYTIGEQYITGKYDPRATKVVLYIDGKAVKNSTLNKENNTYMVAAKSLVTSKDQKVEVVESQGTKELKRVQVNVKEAPQENYVLTADDYTIGEQYITGKYDPRATKVVLYIDGKAVKNSALNKENNTYMVAAKSLVTSKDQKIEVVESQGKQELKRVQVNVKEAPQENYVLTADDYTVGNQYITGKYDQKATKVVLYVDGKVVKNGTLNSENSTYMVAAKSFITSKDQKVEVVASEGTKELKRVQVNVK